MIERLCITGLPILFLIILFGGGERFRRRHLNMDGDAPIDKTLFYTSKYAIVALWAVTIAQGWGLGFSFMKVTPIVRWVAVALWVAGFALLLIGRFEMGDAFRIGSPQERTTLKVSGLFRLSRNPMYVGVFATIVASSLYTLNPAVLLVAAFIVAVHHRIVWAEEEYLRRAFGDEYTEYCNRVRRYL